MSPELEGTVSPVAVAEEAGAGGAPPAAPSPATAAPSPAPPAPVETILVTDDDYPATPVDAGALLLGAGGLSPTASPPSTLRAQAAGGGAAAAAAGRPSALPRAGAFGLSRRMTTTAARPSLLPGGGGGGPGGRPSVAFGGGRPSLAFPRLPQPVFNAAAPRPSVAGPPPPMSLGPLGAARVEADAAAARRASVRVAAAEPAPAPPARAALPTPGGRQARAAATPTLAPRQDSPVGSLMARLCLTPAPAEAAAAAVVAPGHPLVKPELLSPTPAPPTTAPPAPTPLPSGEALARLLALAGQDPAAAADPAGLLPSMDELLELHVGGKAAVGARPDDIVKVGEGTYGEAFRVGGAVVKVVPIDGGALPGSVGDAQKSASELLAEAEIALALTSLREPLAPGASRPAAPPGCPPEDDASADATTGFAVTTAVGVCYGAYSGALARAWRAWKADHGSANPDPATAFGPQAYVLLFGEDGGDDLERWNPASAGEVRSLLLQATLALAVGERALHFEHRDLHWGNVLIARLPPGEPQGPAARLEGADIFLLPGDGGGGAPGIAVTLIDFTLSRLAAAGGGVAYCDLGADPALFAGPRGDAQAETYRRMRRAVRGDWAAHAPATNALWLHYLADVLVSAKAPPPGAGPDEGRALRGFRRRALGAPSAAALLHDEYFEGAWAARAPRGV